MTKPTRSIVVVTDGHKRDAIGWIFGLLENRTGDVVVHFPGRLHPNECKVYRYTRLREANEMEKLLFAEEEERLARIDNQLYRRR